MWNVKFYVHPTIFVLTHFCLVGAQKQPLTQSASCPTCQVGLQCSVELQSWHIFVFWTRQILIVMRNNILVIRPAMIHGMPLSIILYMFIILIVYVCVCIMQSSRVESARAIQNLMACMHITHFRMHFSCEMWNSMSIRQSLFSLTFVL